MRSTRALRWRGALLAAAVAASLLPSLAQAAPGPAGQAEGTITAVDGGTVTITLQSGGPVRIALTGDTVIIQRRRTTLEDIKPNDFVGVTARREADGSLTAISINIFPPEFKNRIREAQFVMDTGNIMTNATVFQNVRRVEGRTLYLRLPDGSVIITVPREAEVFRLTLLKPADLKPGMHVVVRTTTGADGGLVAASITVAVP